MNQKIANSKKINESRLQRMKARDNCIEKIRAAAKERLENEFTG